MYGRMDAPRERGDFLETVSHPKLRQPTIIPEGYPPPPDYIKVLYGLRLEASSAHEPSLYPPLTSSYYPPYPPAKDSPPMNLLDTQLNESYPKYTLGSPDNALVQSNPNNHALSVEGAPQPVQPSPREHPISSASSATAPSAPIVATPYPPNVALVSAPASNLPLEAATTTPSCPPPRSNQNIPISSENIPTFEKETSRSVQKIPNEAPLALSVPQVNQPRAFKTGGHTEKENVNDSPEGIQKLDQPKSLVPSIQSVPFSDEQTKRADSGPQTGKNITEETTTVETSSGSAVSVGARPIGLRRKMDFFGMPPVKFRRLDGSSDPAGTSMENQPSSEETTNSQASATFFNTKTKQINKDIMNYSSWDDILAVLAENKSGCNQVNLSTALFSLSKLLSQHPEDKPKAFQDERFLDLITSIENTIQSFSARNLGQLFFSWANMSYTSMSRTLLEKMLMETKNKISEFQAVELKNVLWALATMEEQPEPELLKVCAEAAVGKAFFFNLRDLSTVLWAFASLKPVLTTQMKTTLTQRIKDSFVDFPAGFNMGVYVSLLFSLAAFEVDVGTDLMFLLNKTLVEQMEFFSNPSYLARAVIAYAKLSTGPCKAYQHVFDVKVYANMEARIGVNANELGLDLLAELVWAFAKLHRAKIHVIAYPTLCILANSLNRHLLHPLSNQELVNLIWAFATFGANPGEITFQRVFSETMGRLGDCNPQQLSDLMSAIHALASKKLFSPSDLFLEAVTNAVNSNLYEMEPGILTGLITTFGRMKLTMNADFLENFVEACLAILEEFSGSQLVGVLQNLKHLKAKIARGKIQSIVSKVVPHLDELTAYELAQMTMSLGALLKFDRENQKNKIEHQIDRVPKVTQLDMLGDKIVQKANMFNPIQLSCILEGFHHLYYFPKPEVFHSLGVAMIPVMSRMSPMDLAKSFLAFSVLRADPPPGFVDKLEEVMEGHVKSGSCHPMDIANTLYSWANLGFRWDSTPMRNKPSTSVLQTFAQEAALLLPVFKNADMIKTVWAFAMLGYDPGREFWIKSRELLSRLDVDRDVNYISCSQLFQAHLLSMYRPNWTEKLFDDPALGNLMNKCRAVWQKGNADTHVSRLQMRVADALRSIVGSNQLTMEWMSDNGLFSVDTKIQYGGCPVLIEVDGPHHFTVNTQRRIGKTLARNFMLRAHNHLVICFPYTDIHSQQLNSRLESFLKSHLDVAVEAYKNHNKVSTAK